MSGRGQRKSCVFGVPVVSPGCRAAVLATSPRASRRELCFGLAHPWLLSCVAARAHPAGSFVCFCCKAAIGCRRCAHRRRVVWGACVTSPVALSLVLTLAASGQTTASARGHPRCAAHLIQPRHGARKRKPLLSAAQQRRSLGRRRRARRDRRHAAIGHQVGAQLGACWASVCNTAWVCQWVCQGHQAPHADASTHPPRRPRTAAPPGRAAASPSRRGCRRTAGRAAARHCSTRTTIIAEAVQSACGQAADAHTAGASLALKLATEHHTHTHPRTYLHTSRTRLLYSSSTRLMKRRARSRLLKLIAGTPEEGWRVWGGGGRATAKLVAESDRPRCRGEAGTHMHAHSFPCPHPDPWPNVTHQTRRVCGRSGRGPGSLPIPRAAHRARQTQTRQRRRQHAAR